MERYRRASAVLERGITAMGGEAALLRAGVLLVEAEGTLDKAVEGQGWTPGAPSPGPYRETFALDLAGQRIAHEYREERFDGTVEWIREAYREGTEHLIVVRHSDLALTFRSPRNVAERRRLYRRIPHLLLAELSRRPAALRWLGERDGEHRVLASLEDGTTLTLAFDIGSGVLRRAEHLLDLEGGGDVVVSWGYEAYEPVDGVTGLLYPRRYGLTVGGDTYTRMAVTRIEAHAEDALFRVPAGVRALPTRTVGVEEPEGEEAELRVREVAAGVYLVPEVRSGFRPMFVELDSFVVAVDAPAGFPLFGQIPTGKTDPGPSGSWVSERYVDAIRRAVPDKPIRYVVLTHAHHDHMAGVRAFVAEGATVLAAPETAAEVRRLVALEPTLGPDRLARDPRPLELEVVDGERVLGGAGRTVRVLDLGETPHHDGMLVVHLPGEDLLFVSDLLTAMPVERYPAAYHEALDRSFVGWLDRVGLEPDTIYTMHGAGTITPAHLERLRGPERTERSDETGS